MVSKVYDIGSSKYRYFTVFKTNDLNTEYFLMKFATGLVVKCIGKLANNLWLPSLKKPTRKERLLLLMMDSRE